MKKKKFNIKKFILFIIVIILICAGGALGTYGYLVSAPSDSKEEVQIEIKDGDNYNSISNTLKEKGLIKSVIAYKIYIKVNNTDTLELGTYSISKNLSVSDLIKKFQEGAQVSTKTVTFVEGKNMRYVVSKIESEFGYKESEILSVLNDKKYLDELIGKYWFLTDEIKNKDIYYSLEGYLYPDTYEFYTNDSIKNIFESMLNNMSKKLEKYKDEVNNSKYTMHQMLTLASIVELEAGSSKDRKGVSGVFYNRIEDGWSLGSDVTTYYAERLDNWSLDLKMSQLNKCNAYNTRSTCMTGKLPVGPVCNPGIDSIVSTIEPTKHKYYYFVADKNGKTYFTKTNSEHNKTVSRLKREGLWIEYQN